MVGKGGGTTCTMGWMKVGTGKTKKVCGKGTKKKKGCKTIRSEPLQNNKRLKRKERWFEGRKS